LRRGDPCLVRFQGRPPLLLKIKQYQRSGVPHPCDATLYRSVGYDAGVPQFCGLTSAQKKTAGGAGTPSDGTVKGLLKKIMSQLPAAQPLGEARHELEGCESLCWAPFR